MAESLAEPLSAISRIHRARSRADSMRPGSEAYPNEAVRVVSTLVDYTDCIQRAHDRLGELAWALGHSEFYARMNSAFADRPPRLFVANPQASRPLSEQVKAVLAVGGTWRFEQRPIAATGGIEDAIARIRRDLADPGG